MDNDSILQTPFYTMNGYFTFYPVITAYDESILGMVGYETVEDPDNPYYGETITGVIHGVPDFFDDSMIAAMFNTQNCEVDVTQTSLGFGTGSVAVIKDTDGNILECYVVILRGDLDGNGMSGENDDATILNYFVNGVEGFEWLDYYDDINRVAYDAADLSYDFWVDVDDFTLIDYYVNNSWDFDPLSSDAYSE